ncbi:MAG: hypothetical protein KA493_04480 [Fusobacteriaceae bacterium]|nr:hypothetical protein [Fusobacteriaceae bacterium]
MPKREIIVFDFETNGFNGTSVLSLSAIKALVLPNGIQEIDRFNRFYYRTPGEFVNPAAINVNGLDESTICKLRGEADYPKHYIDDIESFIEFCGDTDHFIAHNFSFDKDFLGFEALVYFCTFIESKNINIGKFNKLSDLAAYYNIDVNPDFLHNSMYDVEILFDIVKAMYEEKNENLLKFFHERALNKKEQKYIQIRFNSYLKSKRELRDRTEKNYSSITDKSEEIKKAINTLSLPSSDITISQFLTIANRALAPLGLENVTSINFNNFLKKYDILSTVNKLTKTNDNSLKFGIFTQTRISLSGEKYDVILYNALGKKILKEYLIKMLLEN